MFDPIAAGDRPLDAMADVVAQDVALNPAQRGGDRRDLRDDVDAITILVHHARKAAHLAFDPIESLAARGSYDEIHA